MVGARILVTSKVGIISCYSFGGEVVRWCLVFEEIGVGLGVLGIRTPLLSIIGLDLELGWGGRWLLIF